MRLLFVTNGFYPQQNAASYCAGQIIEQIHSRGVLCDVLNVSDSFDLPSLVVNEQNKIFNITNPYAVDFKKCHKGIRGVVVFFHKIFNRLNPYPIKRSLTKRINKTLNRIASNYDLLVALVSDFNNGYAAMEFSKKSRIPFAIYQVDPIGTNYVFKKYKKRLKSFEKELYDKSLFVATTPILKNEKENLNDYNMEKIFALEFPNVNPNIVLKKKYIKTENNRIVCTFCGHLINGVRDCNYILNLFSKIDLPNLLIVFIGKGQEDIIASYEEKILNNHIKQMGYLSKDESNSAIYKSDFLINIGNSMTNQVPSKLFDYISTGHPIINVCKNDNCPTIAYLQQYGLAINLFETEDESEIKNQTNQLKTFIEENVGVTKHSSDIRRIFYNHLPENVGKAFMDILSSHFLNK